jgi:hypothetical protein
LNLIPLNPYEKVKVHCSPWAETGRPNSVWAVSPKRNGDGGSRSYGGGGAGWIPVVASDEVERGGWLELAGRVRNSIEAAERRGSPRRVLHGDGWSTGGEQW